MTIPRVPEIKVALWQELQHAGGTGKAQDIIERLAQRFQLTQTEREQKNPAGNKTFDNRVHVAVQRLRELGWIEPWQESSKSIWKLTLKGSQKVPIY